MVRAGAGCYTPGMKRLVALLACAMMFASPLRAQEEEEGNAETESPSAEAPGASEEEASEGSAVASAGFTCHVAGGLRASYASVDAIVADARRLNFTHAITVDGSQVYSGFGPALPCRSAAAQSGGGGKERSGGRARDGDAGPGANGQDCSQAKARAAAVEKGLVDTGNRDRETEWQVRRSLAYHAIDRYLYDSPNSACAYQEALAAHQEAEDAWTRYTGNARGAKPGHAPICPPGAVPKDRKSRSRCRGAY